MDVRDKLAVIIKDRAYVQAEIARRVRLTPVKFGAVLLKRRKLDANELYRICEVINMSPEEIAVYIPQNATPCKPA